MKTLATVFLLIISMPVIAQGSKQTAPDPVLDTLKTSQTQHLLHLQRSGQHASRNEQTLSGDVQSKVYERYINSFSHPIPQQFSNERQSR